MSIKLYYTPESPPCRLVLMVGAALDLDFDLIAVDLKNKKKSSSYLKINPHNKVPTIDDQGFVMWESRAICRYLINKYAPDSPLYPADPQLRAVIDQRLDFDLGTLCPSFAHFFYPVLFNGATPTRHTFKKLEEALTAFDKALRGLKYAVPGDDMTLADLCLVSSISTMDAAGIDLTACPNIRRWFALVQETAPRYHEINDSGLEDFKTLIRDFSKSSNLKRKRNQYAAQQDMISATASVPSRSAKSSVGSDEEDEDEQTEKSEEGDDDEDEDSD